MTRPLVLPHEHIHRILHRKATLLILTRWLRAENYEIHDAQVIQRNGRYCRTGHSDQQEDPRVFNIDLQWPISHEGVSLLDLDLETTRRAGYAGASGCSSLEDFYQDWLRRRRRVAVEQRVYVYPFTVLGEARYLHRKVQRGYTTNPAEAAHQEGEALTPDELALVSAAARRRREEMRRTEVTRQKIRSLAIRLKEASRTGDLKLVAKIRSELQQLEDQAA